MCDLSLRLLSSLAERLNSTIEIKNKMDTKLDAKLEIFGHI